MSHADERVAAWSETTPVARKQHRCSACLETIEPGYRYVRIFTVYEGEVVTYKHCARCNKLFHEIIDRSKDPVLYTLDCEVSWEEMYGDMPDDIAELAFARPGDFGCT